MNYYFLGAAVLSFTWTAVHIILGGKQIARPLLDSKELHPTAKYVQYYCWHLVSLKIFALGAAFLYSALYPTEHTQALSVFAIALATGFAVLGIALVPLVRQTYKDMPQGWLFVPVAVLGILGVLQT